MRALAKILNLSEARAYKGLKDVLGKEAATEAKLGTNLPSFPIPYRKGERGVLRANPHPKGGEFFDARLMNLDNQQFKAGASGFVDEAGFKPDWFDWMFSGKNQETNNQALKRGLDAIRKRKGVYWADRSAD